MLQTRPCAYIHSLACQIVYHVSASFLPGVKLGFISLKRLPHQSAANIAQKYRSDTCIYRMVQSASAPIAAPSQSQAHESGQKRGCASGIDGVESGLDVFAQPLLPPEFGQPM